MAAPVEPPAALFQKARNTVLVIAIEAAQIPLGLTPQVLNSVDMMTLFADEHVAVVWLIQPTSGSALARLLLYAVEYWRS
ncbi:MAG: hypothetical protein ACXW4A_04710 [Nitrospira sp.]